jgi:hypothetical protein
MFFIAFKMNRSSQTEKTETLQPVWQARHAVDDRFAGFDEVRAPNSQRVAASVAKCATGRAALSVAERVSVS